MQDFGTGCGGACSTQPRDAPADVGQRRNWQDALRAQGWIRIFPFVWLYPHRIYIEYVLGPYGQSWPVVGNTTHLNFVILTTAGASALWGSGQFPPSWGPLWLPFGPICFGTHSRRVEDSATLLEMLRHIEQHTARGLGIVWNQNAVVGNIGDVHAITAQGLLERRMNELRGTITVPRRPPRDMTGVINVPQRHRDMAGIIDVTRSGIIDVTRSGSIDVQKARHRTGGPRIVSDDR